MFSNNTNNHSKDNAKDNSKDNVLNKSEVPRAGSTDTMDGYEPRLLSAREVPSGYATDGDSSKEVTMGSIVYSTVRSTPVSVNFFQKDGVSIQASLFETANEKLPKFGEPNKDLEKPQSKENFVSPVGLAMFTPYQRYLAKWVYSKMAATMKKKRASPMSLRTSKAKLRIAKATQAKQAEEDANPINNYETIDVYDMSNVLETTFKRLKYRYEYLRSATDIENRFSETLKKKLDTIVENISNIAEEIDAWQFNFKDNAEKLQKLDEEYQQFEKDMADFNGYFLIQSKNIEKLEEENPQLKSMKPPQQQQKKKVPVRATAKSRPVTQGKK